MPKKIPTSELPDHLLKIPEWDLQGDRLIRVFEFDAFMDAIDFVNGVAEIANEANHHPNLDIRYTVVKLALTTHDCGGISDRDFKLAAKIDSLVD